METRIPVSACFAANTITKKPIPNKIKLITNFKIGLGLRFKPERYTQKLERIGPNNKIRRGFNDCKMEAGI